MFQHSKLSSRSAELILDSNNPARMTLLSKMSPLAARTLLRPTAFTMPALRESHAALFRKRPAQLIVNRIKDVCHFYFIGIGILPVILCLTYNHIVYGTCELRDYPEGEAPHYWQFERTPVRQWWAKWFGVSDIEHHERNLAYFEKLGIQARWRCAIYAYGHGCFHVKLTSFFLDRSNSV
ncbi:hypothetical protein Y032_0687g1533 [Ancylostoma ceylanicum]|uniref:NADH dehydrogenase [ubiquinone] 1 beta subcomplex subunit 5, mitochondrial n=2 Tax=Ancylostoma ceylanicum TaxID=53326 RepID=A0A016WH08_9BILA|nr:hypothetical protein Y032_0687g1533 [Ancylostoma ceylanicum]